MYSKPNCVQCTQTFKALDRAGLDYDVIDVTTNAKAFDLVQSLGYNAAPVLVSGEIHWSGFRPDRIRSLANTKEGAA